MNQPRSSPFLRALSEAKRLRDEFGIFFEKRESMGSCLAFCYLRSLLGESERKYGDLNR